MDPTESATETDQDEERKAHWFIKMTVSTDLLGVILKCEAAADAWKAIQYYCVVKGASTQRFLRKQVAETRYKEGSMNDHIAFLKSVVEKLSCIDITITDEEYANSLLYSLPTSWDSFRAAIDAQATTLTPTALKAKILQESERRENSSDRDALSKKPTAFYANPGPNWQSPRQNFSSFAAPGRKDKTQDTCNKCGKRGHWAAECRSSSSSSSTNHRPGNGRNGYRGRGNGPGRGGLGRSEGGSLRIGTGRRIEAFMA